MSRDRLALAVAGSLAAVMMAGLGACQGEPRGVDFFVANEAEAKKVQEGCTSGATRGQECENARTALAKIAANRMLEFKAGTAPNGGKP